MVKIMFDDDVPCLTCGKNQIINLECDNHCIRPNCRLHFPEPITKQIKGDPQK